MPWKIDGDGLVLDYFLHFKVDEVLAYVDSLEWTGRLHHPKKICRLLREALASSPIRFSKETLWRLSKWTDFSGEGEADAKKIATRLFCPILRRLLDQDDQPIPNRAQADADYDQWRALLMSIENTRAIEEDMVGYNEPSVSKRTKVAMKPRVSFITLAVDDLERAVRFYRDGLGLATEGIIGTEFEHGAVAFFDLQSGVKLALWPRSSLAHDVGMRIGPRSSTELALANNVATREEVDAVLAEAQQAGGVVVKPGQATFWGGYAGYFQDPDGHLWEVAWNPKMLPEG